MDTILSPRTTILGMASAFFAVTLFSINDVVIKHLSEDYALHQIVLFRALIGTGLLFGYLIPFGGGLGQLRTDRLAMHLVRGGCVVFANVMFFLGLAAMPLAENVAIFFVAPSLIAVFSVVFLGEKVGPHRWGAIAVGFAGVLVMVRPGTDAFQFASLLPLSGAVGYAALNILTRRMGGTESAMTMTFYIQLTFILVCVAVGLAVGDGRFAAQDDPSLAFLFRAWVWPGAWAYPFLTATGLASVLGGYFISVAYRETEAALIAPVEYVALPLSVLWGYVIFSEWPDLWAGLGMFLILVGGLYLIWREAMAKRG